MPTVRWDYLSRTVEFRRERAANASDVPGWTDGPYDDRCIDPDGLSGVLRAIADPMDPQISVDEPVSRWLDYLMGVNNHQWERL